MELASIDLVDHYFRLSIIVYDFHNSYKKTIDDIVVPIVLL